MGLSEVAMVQWFQMDFGALWNNLSIGKLVRSIRLLQILVMHLYMYL